MSRKNWFSRWLIATAVLVVMVATSMAAAEVVFLASAHAQFFDNQQYQYRRDRARPGGFFGNFFGPFNARPYENEHRRPYEDEYGPPQQPTQQPSDSSRAPPPRKTESKGEQVAPAISIVVMGDGMADWLAYGLEDAFSDSPEIGVIRKNKLYSGLLHYEAKSDRDWWHVARDTLANEKADYVIMMLGVSDRQDIREKDLAKEAETRAKDRQAKAEAQKKNGHPAKIDDADEIAASPQSGKKVNGVVEFRSDEWAKIYARRIDETIAALKSKGIPVFWVGLPSIRGTRSTADTAYLNDLYRTRAERAGIVYIDVWDGFVDEAGKYSSYGPDYEGQTRRLRSSDGVFFTKYGAFKLAHYVERELRRYMNNRMVALPSGPMETLPSEEKPAARPLAGPVLPLTGTPKSSDDLLGGAGGSSAQADAIATKVLVKGEAVVAPPGRADNFVWPPGSDLKTAEPVAAAPQLPPAAVAASASVPAEKKQQERKSSSAGKLTQVMTKKPKRPDKPTSSDDAPRPPLPIGPGNSSYRWVR